MKLWLNTLHFLELFTLSFVFGSLLKNETFTDKAVHIDDEYYW